ncbi:MAG: GNAT family N-acetyltransferase, partial [Alphaproteobacteria bacterium]
MDIRETTATDRDFISAACSRAFASPYVISKGQKFHAPDLEGLITWVSDKPKAHITWVVTDGEMEITTLVTEDEGKGYAHPLMEAAKAHGTILGLRRIFLVTTNDNLHALRFYQKLGMRLCALHTGAVDEARKQKPEIPLTGQDG